MSNLGVVIPVGPNHSALAVKAKQSVELACQKCNLFRRVKFYLIDDVEGKLGRSKSRNQGIRKALKEKCDWLLLLDADDVLLEDAFLRLGDTLEKYDVVWGKIADFNHASQAITVRPNQADQINSYTDFLTAVPGMALDMGFLARAKCFSGLSFSEEKETVAETKLFLSLLKAYRCFKAAYPLVAKRWGAHATGEKTFTADEKRQEVSDYIQKCCNKIGLTSRFRYWGVDIAMKITNPSDFIQRSHINRGFYEPLELFALSNIFPKGRSIIDAGSNIGNHAVFFSKFLQPEKVYCFECNPVAIEILKQNLTLNNCCNMELKFLGVGLSDHEHLGNIAESRTNNLGATSFKEDAAGKIQFRPLDSLELQDIGLIKVDCEGMDLEVIRGAVNLIKRDKPILFFECFTQQYEAAKKLLADIEYEIFHEFPCVGACNIVARPLHVKH